MNRRKFVKQSSAAAVALVVAGAIPASAPPEPIGPEPPAPAPKDIERLAAEFAYDCILQFESAERAKGKCASRIAQGDNVEKSVAYLAGILRGRLTGVYTISFFTGLAYWTGQSDQIRDPKPNSPLVYVGSFDFRQSGGCAITMAFGSEEHHCIVQDGAVIWRRRCWGDEIVHEVREFWECNDGIFQHYLQPGDGINYVASRRLS